MEAVVIGATGLVGRKLVEMLLRDGRFARVRTFVRKPSGIVHPLLDERIVDFADVSSWRDLVVGDVLFSALGTTRKDAGSKAAQYEVDYTHQLNFATAALANGVGRYVLVSSVGASPSSLFFYPRIKGELEEKVLALPFGTVAILRPTQLYGQRSRNRPSEEKALAVMRSLNRVGLLRSRRPVSAATVAGAMIEAAFSLSGDEVIDTSQIRLLSREYNCRLIDAGRL